VAFSLQVSPEFGEARELGMPSSAAPRLAQNHPNDEGKQGDCCWVSRAEPPAQHWLNPLSARKGTKINRNRDQS